MRQVELAGQRIEARQPQFHAPPELRQDVVAHRMPGHEVRVVLHAGGNDVVAIAELGQQRIHHRVDRLGRIPHDHDAVAAGRADEACDVVVGRFEAPGRALRCARLPAVHVLVVRRERAVQVQQLARWLRAGRVVGGDPADFWKQEVPADGVDVQRARHHCGSSRGDSSPAESDVAIVKFTPRLTEGLCRSDSPTRSLARRCAGALPPPLKLRWTGRSRLPAGRRGGVQRCEGGWLARALARGAESAGL